MVQSGNGTDGLTHIRSQDDAAYAAAATLVTGGSMRAAAVAAQIAITAAQTDEPEENINYYPIHADGQGRGNQ